VSSLPSHEPTRYDCPFCAIVRGRDDPPLTVQDDVVDRSDATTAWIGSRWWQNNPGNVIVVPNEHVENLYVVTARQAAEIHETARRIALAMKAAYRCDGASTRQHNEPGGNQEIWHYHLHVFPRYVGDGLYGAPLAGHDGGRAATLRGEAPGGARDGAVVRCQTPNPVKGNVCQLCADSSTAISSRLWPLSRALRVAQTGIAWRPSGRSTELTRLEPFSSGVPSTNST
jgi:histidine triad (HIT) family protein